MVNHLSSEHITTVLSGQLQPLLIGQILVAQLGQPAALLGQMVGQLVRFGFEAFDLLGRLHELHVVVVHMTLQLRGRAIAELLDAVATLLQLGAADELVDQVLDI